jgi:uncharacterized membrane protein YcaP (DUF421 family)
MIIVIFSIIVRSISVYLFVILAIRFFGKKELTQLSIIDLVFILLISNSVQNSMVGDNTSLLGGLTAATSLFAVNYILKNLFFRSKKLSSLIQGSPLMLVYRGRVIKHHLLQAKITEDELEAAIREHGVKSAKDVDLAVLEIDGNISVLSENFHRETVKKRHAHKVINQIN